MGKIKQRNVYLQDNFSNNSLTKPIIRELLWGIVEFISIQSFQSDISNTTNTITSDEEIENSDFDSFGFPTTFNSSKRNKKNRKMKKNKKLKTSSTLQLPNCSQPQEDNIFLYINDNIEDYCQINGLGNLENTYYIRLFRNNIFFCCNMNNLHNISNDMKKTAYELLSNYYNSDINPFKNVLDKYWNQRYRLFRRYDEGILLDDESWYSVTPEVISEYIAKESFSCFQTANFLMNCTVLDLFCGCGGNTIAIAAYAKQVISVDIDPIKISYCKNNALIYNVNNKIEYICDDAYNVIKNLQSHYEKRKSEQKEDKLKSQKFTAIVLENNHVRFDNTDDIEIIETIEEKVALMKTEKMIDLVIVAPPWGGPCYNTYEQFDLDTMITSGDTTTLIKLVSKLTHNIILIIPKNCDNQQIHQIAQKCSLRCNIENIHLSGRLKMKVVYFGPVLCPK